MSFDTAPFVNAEKRLNTDANPLEDIAWAQGWLEFVRIICALCKLLPT